MVPSRTNGEYKDTKTKALIISKRHKKEGVEEGRKLKEAAIADLNQQWNGYTIRLINLEETANCHLFVLFIRVI